MGDYEFARILTEGSPGQSFRVVHAHDLVPHLGTCCGREFGNTTCTTDPMCPYHHQTEVFYDNHMLPSRLLPRRYTVCAEGTCVVCGCTHVQCIAPQLSQFNPPPATCE